METQKHSGLGIASFVGSLASGFFSFVLLFVAGLLEATTPGGIDEDSAGAIVLGLSLLAIMGIAIASLVLGICGLCQKARKRIFATLGTVFSALTLSGLGLLLIVGLVFG
jgi:hypothetical protein